MKQGCQTHVYQRLTYQGFTLIELLVAIVVIGILAAIASSSFLNATARARESEAKVNVAAILRSQQMYYTEKGQFAGKLSELGLGIAERTKHYHYQTHQGVGNHLDKDGNQVSVFIAIAKPQTEVRGYMGKVWVDAFNGAAAVKSVACEGEVRETYFMAGLTYCN